MKGLAMGDHLIGATIGQLLDQTAQSYGQELAYVDGDTPLTFAELSDEVDRYAKGLLAMGVGPADRIAIWMPNSLEWIFLFLAAVRIDAVLVPINTAFREEEAAYVLAHSDSSVLVAGGDVHGRDFVREGCAIANREDVDVSTVLAAAPSATDALTVESALTAGDRVSDSELYSRYSHTRADAVTLMLYTSGTTGFPKGAMHSHKMIRNAADVAERLQVNSGDTLVLYLPLFHVYGVTSMLSFLCAGATVVLMDRFDARVSLELMQDEGATVASGINTMYYDQLHHPAFSEYDLSSLRFCLTAGNGELVRLLTEQMAPAINFYGMTETTSMTTVQNLGDPLERRMDTVGYPLPGFDVRVADSAGRTLPPDCTGEIAVRGHPVMLGYYKNEAATAACFDSAGWFHTGDAGQMTRDGYLRYLGRIKDMLKVGGENVDPGEVETVLMRNRAVSLAAVVGVPDERLDEVPIACVELKPDARTTSEELREYTKGRLAHFKVPREVHIVDELPRTGSGKIQKFRLREQFAGLEGELREGAT
jgi:fatty-acyl-CoA synthase